MKDSDNPVENFEYELDQYIGSDKLHKGFKRIVDKFVPSKASLEFLIEKRIFESEVFKELNLFPLPKSTKYCVDHHKGEMMNKDMFITKS